MKRKADKSLNILVGKKLASLRNCLGCSQEKVAEATGLTQKGLSLIECGSTFPTPDTLLKLADFYNVEIKEFFTFSDSGKNSEILKDIKNKLNLIKNDNSKLKTVQILLNNLI